MAKFNKSKPKTNPTGDVSVKTQTHQGGLGYTYKSMMKLYSILTTQKFEAATFYRSTTQMETDLINAVKDCVTHHGEEFTAKLIVHARSKDGHRTSSHIAAVALMEFLSGKPFAKAFFSKRERRKMKGGVVFRLDDMYEIFCAYQYIKVRKAGKNPEKNPAELDKIKMPNSMRKGFKKALESADWYEMAKYQAKTKSVSLVDLINLVHPEQGKSRAWKEMSIDQFKAEMEKARTKRNTSEIDKKINEVVDTSKDGVNVRISAFTAAIYGFLKQEDTAENKNSESGQKAAEAVRKGEMTKEEAAKELEFSKSENWSELITDRKLGYLALLRNLRNIHDSATKTNNTGLIQQACLMLIDVKLIQSPSNLIWPYQIEQARDIMLEVNTGFSRSIVQHLDRAYEAACPNLVNLGFFGRNAVIVDTSASMGHYQHNATGKRSPLTIASLIAGTLAKGTNAELYQFADYLGKINYNIGNSPFEIAKTVGSQSQKFGSGTNFMSIFGGNDYYHSYYGNRYNESDIYKSGIDAADRIFIISDMQNGSYMKTAYQQFLSWCGKNKVDAPYVYLINVNSYGTTVMPDGVSPNIVNISGYSINMLELLIKSEADPHVLYNEINEIDLEPLGEW